MDFKTFAEKIEICSKTEIEKVKLVAFYLIQYNEQNEFNLETVLSLLDSIVCSISNISRIRNRLKKDRNFKKNTKTDCWTLNGVLIKKLQKDYKEILNDRKNIESNSELLDENKFTGKRGYLDKLITQANNCYKNNCYDACAVMLRRIFEITLIQ